jgi:hypothetical protein
VNSEQIVKPLRNDPPPFPQAQQLIEGGDSRPSVDTKRRGRAIVKSNDVARIYLVESSDDLLRCCSHAVISAAGPGHNRVTIPLRGAHDMRRLESHRRAKQRRPLPDDSFDDRIGAANLVIPVAVESQGAQVRVLEAVIADDVSLGVHAFDQVRQLCDVLSHDEERRLDAVAL